ncbi:MAG: hypothetical protein KDJ80_08525 [Nitratireductor sp.]|nr:hypothetical protein [Nitratireductor sp.]
MTPLLINISRLCEAGFVAAILVFAGVVALSTAAEAPTVSPENRAAHSAGEGM